MLLSDQIAGFFDDQCLWKESEKVLGFLFRNSYPGKIASKINTVDLGWPGVLSHIHTNLHLLNQLYF